MSDLVERVAMILMGQLIVSQEGAAHIWHGMYEPEKEQFRRVARVAIAVALEEAARVADSACIPMCEGSADLIAAAIRAMIPSSE